MYFLLEDYPFFRNNIEARAGVELPKRSAFLWGPRKTGKTFWLRQTYPQHVRIDLLQTDVFGEYAARPALLRERHQDQDGHHRRSQMVPELLNEVTGSSRIEA
jgi:hypothetical protein